MCESTSKINSTKRITKYGVDQVLLHRGEMLFIDEIIGWGDEWIECTGKRNVGQFFNPQNGEMPAWCGIEYMAQAVAAMEGIRMLQHGVDIRMSFIIGAKKIKSYSSFIHSDQQVRVKASMFMRDETGLGVYDCSLLDSHGMVLAGRIKGAMPNDPNIVFDKAR